MLVRPLDDTDKLSRRSSPRGKIALLRSISNLALKGVCMPDERIPSDLRSFVLRYIDSVGQLEALLLLRRNPNERWDQAKIVKRLYTTDQEAEELLARLCEEGLLKCSDGTYSYECNTAEQQRMVNELTDFYSRHLIPVTNLIHSKPRRIREFANAFKLKRDS